MKFNNNDNEIVLGQHEYGELYTADIKDGIITRINGYYIISKHISYDGNTYMECCSAGGDATINGITYTRGMLISEDHEPFFNCEGLEEIVENNDFYEANGFYCGECGTFHNSDQYHNVSYVILNECEVFCKTCVSTDDMLEQAPVNNVDDIYKAKDIVGMDSPEHYEEVETIFHDCGWGGPATNHAGATKIVDELVEEHGELYAGLTGIGQFQVYVTLYKRVG